MIRRFFDLCDRNKDGLLSVAYFNNYVLGQPNMPEGFRYEPIDVDKVLLTQIDRQTATYICIHTFVHTYDHTSIYVNYAKMVSFIYIHI